MLIASYLYAIGIILFPFYIFPSGTPQPAHILLLLGAIIAIVKKSQSINLLAMPAVKILVLFVGYVCIVNLVNAIIFGGMSTSDASSTGALPIPRFAEPLAYASFYVFNLFILLGAICLCTEQSNHTYIRFWKIIMISIVVSLLIQTALDLIGLGRTYKTSFRHILYFNNPNQLGY